MHLRCLFRQTRPLGGTLFHVILCPCAAWALVALTGCQQEKTRALGSSAQARAAQTGPEESFQRFVEIFRHEVAEPAGVHLSKHEGTFSKLQYEREVLDELIPPSKEKEPYRGRITVKTRSTYTYRGALEEPGSESDGEGGMVAEYSGDDDFASGQDPFAALDQAALEGSIDTGRRGVAGIPEAVVHEYPNAEVQIYDLAYEDNRWVLKTEPDAKTERFIQAAFDFALQRQ